jgi:anhydro-N-acetylmuramic acid kinase
MDRDGQTGESGRLSKELLNYLNSLPFYSIKGPRSLGKEWFEETFLPAFYSISLTVPDQLRTVYEHIAIQIAGSLGNRPDEQVLVTGGGAHNPFLIGLIKKYTPCKLVIPDSILVDFKEAIVFAFLGLLKYLGKTNCYASVTGARQDSVCGEIHPIII